MTGKSIGYKFKMWALPEDGRYELLDGERVNMDNSGREHGYSGSWILDRILLLFALQEMMPI